MGRFPRPGLPSHVNPPPPRATETDTHALCLQTLQQQSVPFTLTTQVAEASDISYPIFLLNFWKPEAPPKIKVDQLKRYWLTFWPTGLHLQKIWNNDTKRWLPLLPESCGSLSALEVLLPSRQLINSSVEGDGPTEQTTGRVSHRSLCTEMQVLLGLNKRRLSQCSGRTSVMRLAGMTVSTLMLRNVRCRPSPRPPEISHRLHFLWNGSET